MSTVSRAAVMDFQTWASLGGYLLDVDGIFGAESAKAYVALMKAGKFLPTAGMACGVRAAVAVTAPKKKAVETFYGHVEYVDVTKDGKKTGAIQVQNKDFWRHVLHGYEIAPGVVKTFHYKAAAALICAMGEIAQVRVVRLVDLWIPKSIGTYCARHNMWDASKPLSRHTYGCAVDFDPKTNRVGTRGDIPQWVIDIFKSWGFTWGGDWKMKDAMHFEWTRA